AGLSAAEWRAVVGRSRAIGCARFVLATVHACAHVFPDALSPTLIQTADHDAIARDIGNEVLAHLFERSTGATPTRVFASRPAYAAALDERTVGKALDRAWRFVAPNSADYAWLALPPRLNFAYFALRPVRLLLQGPRRENVGQSGQQPRSVR